MPISAVDAIGPAFEHTKQQLLKPFRIAQWAKLALVGFLAGELGSGGGCSVPNIPNMPHNNGGSQRLFDGDSTSNLSNIDWSRLGLPNLDARTMAIAIAFLIVAFLVLGLLFIYLNSVMRFILFDSVITRQCNIRQNWGRRYAIGMRFFVWQILLALGVWAAMAILVGIPAAIAFALGWFKQPDGHMLPLVLGGIFLFLIFFVLFVGVFVVTVLTKDFVVPQMALENISAVEGWRRLLPMMSAEKGSYAGYIGMKIVLALAASVVFGIITIIVFFIMLIPVGAVGVAAMLGGKAAGLTWDLYTITFAVTAGCIAIAVMLYVISFVSVPVVVFFPAYSIYFFAGRYPALNALLHPVPPAPPTPPPLLPTPEPIG